MIIGVLVPPDEAAAAEEFFQLFKTPWEFYVAGRTYDVIITTVGEAPESNSQLTLAFGSSHSRVDRRWGLRPGLEKRASWLECGEAKLPLYGRLLTFHESRDGRACLHADGLVAGIQLDLSGLRVVRLGYDLFREVQHLLSEGQPLEHALVPTLDLHIDILRNWILEAGLPVVEIPPVPSGCTFGVCLTHDIDFIGIRHHRFDHTMWGFLLRATFGAFRKFLQRRIGVQQLCRSWSAAATLPLIYLGLAKDYWTPFEWYLAVEKGLGATYYLIPFKGRAGERVPSGHPERRAAAYELSDLSDWIPQLEQAGCEVGVHGIDAWHSVEKGAEEKSRISAMTGKSNVGIRMHWLLRDANTFRKLEEAGYDYDTTVGYNETPGYRTGTNQVYRPDGARRLLELPMHIQDGALFFPQRLDLAEPEAWELCASFIQHARTYGGVLTLLWHDRSHGPERFWGDFYARLIGELKGPDVWFATAGEIVEWFRVRRAITFERRATSTGAERVTARLNAPKPSRPFVLRTRRRPTSTESGRSTDGAIDMKWSGEEDVDLSCLIQTEKQPSVATVKSSHLAYNAA